MSTLTLLLLVCAAITATAFSVPSNEVPTMPQFGSQLSIQGDMSIPDEGVSFQTEIHIDGVGGAFFQNRSTPNGWYNQLMLVNHTDTNYSKMYIIYPINGVVKCYAFTMPGKHVPSPALPPLKFARRGIHAGKPGNVFRQTNGKFVGTIVVSVDGDFINAYKTDMTSCASTVDWTYHNNSNIDPSVFAVPSACEEADSRATPEEAEQMADSLLNPVNTGKSFSDFTTVEDALQRRTPSAAELFTASELELSQLPPTIDNRHFATPVRNQAFCGGCWAFASVAATEVAFNKANNFTIPPGQAAAKNWGSVQNVLDCAHGNLDGKALIIAKGCSGGWPLTALTYIVNNGIQKDTDYTFDGVTGSNCRQNPAATMFPLVAAMELPYLKSETGVAAKTKLMMAAVAKHGAVVAIMTVDSAFMFYGGGIINNPTCKPSMDHAVTVVGYGTDEEGTDYWLVKNSLGGNWGVGGYFRIARGINMCGIEAFGAVPVAAVH